MTQLSPGTSSVGARIVQPAGPLPMSSIGERTTRERKKANASVPSARFTPPSRVSGHAISAPSAAAASAPITTAQKKLI